jgi:hypothetical protein
METQGSPREVNFTNGCFQAKVKKLYGLTSTGLHYPSHKTYWNQGCDSKTETDILDKLLIPNVAPVKT